MTPPMAVPCDSPKVVSLKRCPIVFIATIVVLFRQFRQEFCNFAAAMAKKETNNIKIKNKRATFEYFLVETLTAGIVLTGTEIKSIRGGKASLADSYCSFKGNELFVIGMHIAEYAQGTYNNHDPKRDRKLLLNARELRKL